MRTQAPDNIDSMFCLGSAPLVPVLASDESLGERASTETLGSSQNSRELGHHFNSYVVRSCEIFPELRNNRCLDS